MKLRSQNIIFDWIFRVAKPHPFPVGSLLFHCLSIPSLTSSIASVQFFHNIFFTSSSVYMVSCRIFSICFYSKTLELCINYPPRKKNCILEKGQMDACSPVHSHSLRSVTVQIFYILNIIFLVPFAPNRIYQLLRFFASYTHFFSGGFVHLDSDVCRCCFWKMH